MKCKICTKETDVLKIKELVYHKCSNCGFIFLDDKFYPELDVQKERYELHNNSLENEGYVKMFEDFISKCILPFKDNSAKCLDFGSGPEPVLAELLKRRGFDVDIFDLHFTDDDSYMQKKYDVVCSTEVFEHLLDPITVLKKLVGLLSDGGIISIMTQFSDNQDFEKWRYRNDITHMCFFSKKSLELMAENLGLKVLFMDERKLCVLAKK